MPLPQITAKRILRFFHYVARGELGIVADRVGRAFRGADYEPLQLSLIDGATCPQELVFPTAGFADPLVSIIVPVHNQWAATRACLAAVLAHTSLPYEVILADDASSDETRNAARLIRNVRIVRQETNAGFLRNCNAAARHARGKYLVLLNNDTNVQPDWLGPLVDLAERDAGIALVGGMLLYPDGKLQEAGGVVWSGGGAHIYGRLEQPERPEFNYVKAVDYVSGACLLVRHAFWKEVGGFDERLAPAYYEDTDLAFEARKRGWKVVYQPASRTVHFEGLSHGRDVASGTKAYQEINRGKFRDKWHDTLREQGRGEDELFRARDRSLQRKTLLYVDHHVPFRDRDAGSRSTFQYLKLMAELGYNLKFIGDNFTAHQPYTAELQQLGIEVLYGRPYARGWKRWLHENGRNIDYVYLSRPQVAITYLETVRRTTAARIAYCGHDLHSLRAQRRLALEPSARLRRAAARWEKMELDVLRQVDVAYFFSPVEVDEVQHRLGREGPPDVKVIPLFLLEPRPQGDSKAAPGARKDLLFVANFLHPPNASGLRWFIAEVLPALRQALGDVRVRVVGAAPPEITALQNDGIAFLGYLPDAELSDEYARARVVVAPLRYGAGIKGKVVEAMYHGVPVITTSAGAEGIGGAAEGLTVVDDAAGFARDIATLCRDDAVWSRRAADAAAIVVQRFSKESARRILLADMPVQ